MPSDWVPPQTNTIGAFQVRADKLARWLADGYESEGISWQIRTPETRSIERLIRALTPNTKPGVSEVVVLGFENWSIVVNNGILGTDVGMLPSLCARELGRMALRATVQDDRPHSFGATVLEVFSPDADLPLRCQRTISAANDGGRWKFSQFGKPYPFEHVEAYRRRSIRERFPPSLIGEYLQALDVPCISKSEREAEEAYVLAHRSAA